MELINPTNEIATALAKAQAEMSNPKFDRTNPHFRNKFASLAAVRDAVVPVFAKHGIACIQDLTRTEGGVACTTHLYHSSGQVIHGSPFEVPVTKQDAQGYGSAGTYARRYDLMAFANVVGDEDDDANAATGKPGAGWDHKPMGDTEETLQAKLYASNFAAAFSNDDVLRAQSIHADLHNEGEEAYRNAWALLDSKTRTWAKKAIAASKSMNGATA